MVREVSGNACQLAGISFTGGMKRLLPLVLAIASAAAADPVVIELPRAGGPLRVAVAGDEFELRDAAGRLAVRVPAAKDAAGVRRSAAALSAAHPGSRVGLVGRLLGVRSGRNDRVVVTGRVVLEVPPGVDGGAFLAARGLRQVQGFAWSARHVVAEPLHGGAMAAVEAAIAVRAAGAWAEPELSLPFVPFAEPTDPLYANNSQWHLKNLGTNVAGGLAGVDINIVPHWTSLGIIRTGSGINVAVVDDGLDLTHPDLVAGVRTDIDADVAVGDTDPSHGSELGHGTVVGGLIGARANAAGGVGVAYGSSLVGVKIFLGGGATQTAAASGLGYRATATSDVIHVSNNSWGPDLGGTEIMGLDALSLAAITAGVDQGRGGRGTVYVFAGGNSRVVYDSFDVAVGNDTLDYNGYGGNRRVIAVGALKPNGLVTSYSEPGIGLLLSAPGGDGADGAMVTTDWQGDSGFQAGDYTQQDPPDDVNGATLPNSHEAIGTSFSAPLVSGAVALMLEANPQLSWRDVQHVLAHSASAIYPLAPAPAVPIGVLNGAGLRFHNDYGAGRLNVSSAIALASAWQPLPPESSVTADSSATPLDIPEFPGAGIHKDFAIVADADFTVERAELTVNITHTYRGDLKIRLIAPSGYAAAVTQRQDDFNEDLVNWTFSSVQTMGESASGTWRVEVTDVEAIDIGTLDACTLTLYGYRPYSAPVITETFPSAVLNTQATTVVSVRTAQPAISEGGDLFGTLSLGATSGTVSYDAVNWPSLSIPAATFAAIAGPFPTTVAVTLTNPTVRGVNYALAGGGPGTFLLPVRSANAVPVGTATNGAVVAGFPTTSGSASFSDTDGDTMRYRLGTAPAKGTATINLLTGVVTYTPTITSYGSDSLTVIATDGMGDSAPVTVTYEIERNVSVGLDVPAEGSSGSSGGGDGGGGGGCGAGAVGLLAGLGVLLGLRRRRR